MIWHNNFHLFQLVTHFNEINNLNSNQSTKALINYQEITSNQ